MSDDIVKELESEAEFHGVGPLSTEMIAAHEIKQLRIAVCRFGDRARMATVEPMELQQAIDRAFEFES